MKKIKIGILGASEIACRRFLPALQACEQFTYAGVASKSKKRLEQMHSAFGGAIYDSYEEMIADPEIDALYIPLIPALHYENALSGIQRKKHILIEKPATTNFANTKSLIDSARQNNVAVYENFAFLFHPQMQCISQLLNEDAIGTLRHYDIRFGYPRKPQTDYRYDKSLGGGALLDCGVYPLKLAQYLLGQCKVEYSSLTMDESSDIDIFGAAVLKNDSNQTASISFGMDNEYQCSLEIWGSKGMIKAARIFSAPPGMNPPVILRKDGKETLVQTESCDQFIHAIRFFGKCIWNHTLRELTYQDMLVQAEHVEMVRENVEQ